MKPQETKKIAALVILLVSACLCLPMVFNNIGNLGAMKAAMAGQACDQFTQAALTLGQQLSFDSAQANRWMAVCAEQEQDWLLAANLLTSAISTHASYNRQVLLLKRADMFFYTGNIENALKDWREAKASPILMERANNAIARDNLQEGIQWLQYVVTIDPENPIAYWKTGQIFQEWENYPEAEQAYYKAIRLDPYNLDIILSFVKFLFGIKNDYPAASQLLEWIRLQWPHDPEIMIVTGQFYSQQELFIDAAYWYSKAAELDPENPQPVLLSGIDWMAQGLPAQALEEFLRARNLPGGDSPTLAYNMATAYLQLGQVENAIMEYEKAVQGRPDYMPYRLGAGQAYEFAGNNCEAIRHYQAAYALQPDNQWVINRLNEISGGSSCSW